MMKILITEKERDAILKLCEDWGFEYSLQLSSEEVEDLRKSLEATIITEESEMEDRS